MKYLLITTLMISFAFGLFAWPGVSAEDSSISQEISKKLDTVITGQREMMAAITSLKEEMRVLKIRVTQAQ